MLRPFRIFIIAFAVLPPLFARAQSANLNDPCPVNQDGLVANASAVKDVVDKDEAPPFAKACGQPGALKDRPSTSFLHIFPPTHDGKGRLSLDFFERLQKKVAAKVVENEGMGKAIAFCADPKNASLKCASGKEWIANTLPKSIQNIRYNLALADNPDGASFFKAKPRLSDLNADLNPIGSYKESPWAPLTDAEKTAANKILDTYKVRARDESAKEKNPRAYAKDMIRTLRYQHYEEYLKQMAQMPFAQYLKSATPSESEVQSAAQEFTKNVSKERRKIEGLAKDIADARKQGNGVPSDVMELLNYSSLVEETLLEAPEYCGLATSLIYSRTNKQMATSLAIGLPVLAATFFAPPLGAVLVGVTGGALTLGLSQIELNEAKRQGLDSFYNDDDASATRLKAIADAESERNLNLMILPMGYGLGGAAVNSVKVMAKAAIAGTRLGVAARSLRETTSIAADMRAALGPAEF